MLLKMLLVWPAHYRRGTESLIVYTAGSNEQKKNKKIKTDQNKTRSGAVYFSVGSMCFIPPSSSVLKMKTCFSLGFSHCFCLKSTEKENPWFRTDHYNKNIKCMPLKVQEVEARAFSHKAEKAKMEGITSCLFKPHPSHRSFLCILL